MNRTSVFAKIASAAYTICFVVGSGISVRRGHRARPIGIRTGLSPWGDLAVGGGAALAAPWPLITLLWVLHSRAGREGARARKARAALTVLSGLFLAGAVAEPISHDLIARRLPPDETVVAALNILLPIAMMASSAASLVDPEV